MVPASERDPNHAYLQAIEDALRTWEVPVLVAFSDRDVVFKADDGRRIAEMVPNGRFHLVRGAGHFLQDEAGEELAERTIAFLRDEAGVR